MLGRACASTRDDLRDAPDEGRLHGAPRAAAVPGRSGLHAPARREQMLMASSTTEGAGGGNVRSSAARDRRRRRRASNLSATPPCISYGESADAIVTTARRAPDAAGLRSGAGRIPAKGDYMPGADHRWDTLGMRGTCSAGFTPRAQGDAEQMLPLPYEAIHRPDDGAGRASVLERRVDRCRRRRGRAGARASCARPPASGGQLPPGAAHLTARRRSLRNAARHDRIRDCRRFEASADEPRGAEAIDFQAAMNLLKVNASELAVATVMSALRACGLSGYRNDSEFSDRPASARRPLLADHDQQRPHPRQRAAAALLGGNTGPPAREQKLNGSNR